jgi:hypothetical protein
MILFDHDQDYDRLLRSDVYIVYKWRFCRWGPFTTEGKIINVHEIILCCALSRFDSRCYQTEFQRSSESETGSIQRREYN